MDNELLYMPTFRVRQQESLVLRSFDFGNNMYPLLEIVKEFDRSRKEDAQKSFSEIHLELIGLIKAEHVFVDLPVYLKQSGAVKDEVINFGLKVLNNLEIKCDYINQLESASDKMIPVISSFLLKTGEIGTIQKQKELLSPSFTRLAYRLFPQSFSQDFPIVSELARADDYIIIDLDQIIPYHKSPPLRPIVEALKQFDGCRKILLRSALNSEIQNVKLDHGQVIFEADNSQIDSEVIVAFGVSAFGDYVGVKKDELTAGGSISPGFIYFDAVENQYYGYKAAIKGNIDEFANTIVPAVINSPSSVRMLAAVPPFLKEDNLGYKTLIDINSGIESGRSQAKFKRISMEHYLYCIKVLINSGKLAHP
jgi:hypothetical protein